jgi:hypothetical protein
MGREGFEPSTLGLRDGRQRFGWVRLPWNHAGLRCAESPGVSVVFGGSGAPVLPLDMSRNGIVAGLIAPENLLLGKAGDAVP